MIIKCFFTKKRKISKFHLETGSCDAMYRNKTYATPSDLKNEELKADKKEDLVESGIPGVEADALSSSTKAKRQKQDRKIKSLPLLHGPEVVVSSKKSAKKTKSYSQLEEPQAKMEMVQPTGSNLEVKKLAVESGTQLNESTKKTKKRERKTMPEAQGQGKQSKAAHAKSASHVKTSEKESADGKTPSATPAKKPAIALKPRHLAGRKRRSSLSALEDVAEGPAVTPAPCSECESDPSILEKVVHRFPTNLEDIPAAPCSGCETDSSILENIVHHLPTNLDQVSADTPCSDCQSDASLLEDIVHNFPSSLRRFSVVTHPQDQTQTLEVLEENSPESTLEEEAATLSLPPKVDQRIPRVIDEDCDGYISVSHGKHAISPPGEVLPSDDTPAAADDIHLQHNEAYNQISFNPKHSEGSDTEIQLQHNEAYSINPESSANPKGHDTDDITNVERIYENTINCTWIPTAERAQEHYDYIKS